MTMSQSLKDQILELVRTYYETEHQQPIPFKAGTSPVRYGGRVFDHTEMQNAVSAALDFWLTHGEWANQFEAKLAATIGVKYASYVNSGSSANLLAFMALTSHQLGERAIQRGDEVITVAAGFPTTIAPLVQFGAIPVFIDIKTATVNVDCKLLESALSPKTKAVMLAHTLGNPFDCAAVRAFCDAHGLWLIEDNCDALGSRFNGKLTGTFGDIATSSFYPAHHITTGEGGAVYTNDAKLHRIINSFRDWGRDCWCDSGKDNTCRNRFTRQFGRLPIGYDHKYVYSHFGYNLKATDLQAAIGVAQLDKLEQFTALRKENFGYLKRGLQSLSSVFIFPETEVLADPSWFGFVLTRKPEAKFTRNELTEHLEKHHIQTRNVFGGNLIMHPCFDPLVEGRDYRIAGSLTNTDQIMTDAFWIGVYPGMTREMLDYMIATLREFVEARE